MREIFVTELAREVLGPRGGAHETLSDSPLSEYITGVLAPAEAGVIPRDVDSEADIPAEDAQDYEEETSESDVNVPPLFSPALNPKNRPPTMGISFALYSSGPPVIDVCTTWARYFHNGEGKGSGWRRMPRYCICRIQIDTSKTFWIDENGRIIESQDKAEISFHVMVRHESDNRHSVTLYLVNRISVGEGKQANPEQHIFQPQIRVLCDNNTQVVSGRGEGSHGSEMEDVDEDELLEFLYRNKNVLARGHLCSAVWRQIDPQILPQITRPLDFPQSVESVPFVWQDGEILPSADRNRFSNPDVRTEFVPVYSIPAPDLDWRAEYGREPELSCQRLSEMWHPQELRDSLAPLLQGYASWINGLQRQAVSLTQQNPRYGRITDGLIRQNKLVLERMSAGVDLLCTDEDARLAFCFANKVADLQSRWKRGKGMTWRPFQLAFVLLTLESITNPDSRYRDVCDLLWVPTGGGKTEAYLATLVFTLAYRRRRSLKQNSGMTAAGVSAISRYTLRLLTIQQFRRTLEIITACEYLRVHNLSEFRRLGWRPQNCEIEDNFLWGTTPFSAGLWVGGNVTPNRLKDTWGGNQTIHGAISILKGVDKGSGQGEPAQILECPACGTLLAVPEMGLRQGKHTLYFVIRVQDAQQAARLTGQLAGQMLNGVKITDTALFMHGSAGYCTLKLEIEAKSVIHSGNIDGLWSTVKEYFKQAGRNVELVPARASRMGYFIRYFLNREGKPEEYDFQIVCPNPNCELHKQWCAGAPMGWLHGEGWTTFNPPEALNDVLTPDGNRLVHVLEPFRENSPYISDRIPIPAMTVDDQIYHRLPSMVVATVDKFARMPFEPRIAALFGNVQFYHAIYGYYRPYQHPAQPTDDKHPEPLGRADARLYASVVPLPPPEVILQDELHLIEGPLGSLTGIYESAIGFLCSMNGHIPKYIASTATVRRAKEQVQALFLRGLQVFPPHGLTADDRFFISEKEAHPLSDEGPGRLYVGICAPGRGGLTPVKIIWARLLQTAWFQRTHQGIDDYWTLTGYFNAVRELAGAMALYNQDIPVKIMDISQGNPRTLPPEGGVELSSRTPAIDLPSILDMLRTQYPEAPDALFTTSMFGTGVDIPRIGLMVVGGQPKTTSAYIQSTGRVGRRRGALVVTFFRATRPRDLSHYEFFCGYHRQLHMFVEPITVYPFAPGVLDRAGGPVGVGILRNMRGPSVAWDRADSARLMATVRTSAHEVKDLPDILEKRAQHQPSLQKPSEMYVKEHILAKLDTWQQFATNFANLGYVEYAISKPPTHPVVLGDAAHYHRGLGTVYENAPQSLRDIEEMTSFET